MFNLFRKNKDQQPVDVKILREEILHFVKEELQKLEGGEGRNVESIQLYAVAPAEERHLYEAALYIPEPALLKQEVQRISDNFAVDLPLQWTLETGLKESFPVGAALCQVLPLSFSLKMKTVVAEIKAVTAIFETRGRTALLQILNGQAEKQDYVLRADDGRINLGREKSVPMSNGSVRINNIAFPGDADHTGNRFVSRQHAHLEWDEGKNGFMLFADEGGIPPGNKTKIKTLNSEDQLRLNSAEVGYLLEEGDQIILGESVVLGFSYTKKKEDEL
nr:FHA domain-containing protein [Pedobacter sp. ASV19]